jgi:DNA-binding CsgD family transcriptional regulator
LESALKRMKEMRVLGKTLKEIGVEFGIAPATVLRYLKT